MRNVEEEDGLVELRACRCPLGFWQASFFVLVWLSVTALAYLSWRPEFKRLAKSEYATFRAQSRSMEPTWKGPRFETKCPKCDGKATTSIDITSVASNQGDEMGNNASPEVRRFRETVRTMVCPNCGFDRIDASAAVFRDGDLFLAQSLEGSKRALERWSVALFCNSSGRYMLKRIVGLPGELVELRNGDVWIDGEPTQRTTERIWNMADAIRPTVETRTSDRLLVTRVVNLRKASTDGVERAEAVPSAISNESSTPCFGVNSGSVELVRDFLIRFHWDATGVGGDLLTIIVRRPESAWSLEYTVSVGRIVVKTLPLVSGRTISGKRFEELDATDFASVRGVSKKAPTLETSATLIAAVMAVDGELVFEVDGKEFARFTLGDVASDATEPISTPFVIIGDVSRASEVSVYRDVHYSSWNRRAELLPDDRCYALGDNSPASLDSRFSEVGAIPTESVRYTVAPLPESR